MNASEKIHQQLKPLLQAIQQHSLYADIRSVTDLRIFMEHHVFAVWDFMCLLKELHHRLVTTRAPWFPPKNPFSAHLIGKILMEEESDQTPDGQGYCSHFELYLTAMRSIGAHTQPIEDFLSHLSQGDSLMTAAQSASLPVSVQQFMLTTFGFFSQETHSLAAAFVYGREAVTTALFPPLITQLRKTLPKNSGFSVKPLLYYLNRHIQLDSENHFPHALKILNHLTGDSRKKSTDILFHAELALKARLNFLTAIQMKIHDSQQALKKEEFMKIESMFDC